MAKVTSLDVRTVGNTAYPLTAYLTDRNGPLNLTGATALLELRRPDGTVKLSTAMTVTSPGYVSYAWQSGDVTEAGVFHVRILVTLPSGLFTFPPNGWGELIFLAASP